MIKRAYQTGIEQRLFKGKAIIILGPRQAGKTTLIEHIRQARAEKSLLLNGDEPDIRELLSEANSERLRTICADNQIICIDEAQRIPNIGLTVKLFTDQIKEKQVIVSGSSALHLNSLISEPLTGRKYEYTLLPLSFAEMCDYHGLLSERRLLEHRLIYGYYPEIVVKTGEEKELLKLLSDSYLYKDILSMGEIKKPVVLEKILQALALQIGSEVSYNELGQLLGINKNTVEKYIDLLEKAFVVFRLPAFNRNVRNEIKKGRKIYFFDNGIRNAVIRNFNLLALRNDIGALWENFLISERKKYLLINGKDNRAFFWRTTQQQEIDYIEERGGELNAYEFKWAAQKRIKIPLTFQKAYQPASTQLITRTNFDSFLGV
ncbi:MAG: ATP-binding protein [Calditrichales bacterium]|nr:MAG: ATP-binding protein [Calditrichales bacterium]